MGRELNPRIGPIDLKFFCELRPGLIGWVILDLSFIAEVIANGQSPAAALLLVTAFHALYVADALYHEVVNNSLLICDVTLCKYILLFDICCHIYRLLMQLSFNCLALFIVIKLLVYSLHYI